MFNLREEEVQQLRNASFPRFSWVSIALQLAFRFPFPFPFSWVLFLWLLWLLFLLVSFRFIGAAFGLFVAIFSSLFFSVSVYLFMIFTQSKHSNATTTVQSVTWFHFHWLAYQPNEFSFLDIVGGTLLYIFCTLFLCFFADKVA